ncbi:MAG: DNA polymerase [Euryarchaeota archaeon]|nr:DNA polymerase [Euryarchaeota archaeon]
MDNEVVGFNLAFDHFHLCKLYTIFSLFPDCHAIPEEHIEKIARLEPQGRDGQCLKPRAASDIMLQARKGKYQSTMDRRDIKIRKIPAVIAKQVRDILEATVKLDDIYFARRKDVHAPHWQIMDRDNDVEFQDIVLKFKASSALKNLAIHALGKDPMDVLRFGDIHVEKRFVPLEVGYAPFALAISSPDRDWRAKLRKGSGWQRGYAWPAVIQRHISHWGLNRLARQYAKDDVVYTRELYKHLDSPEPGDDDSELACMVGAVRWKGFKVDLRGIKELRKEAYQKSVAAPRAPAAVKYYLLEVMDETEALIVETSTKKVLLEEVAIWEDDDGNRHKAADRAQEVLDARMAKWECDLYDKLLQAGRFHASFRVIGALSSRMSGGDDLNAQGIKRAKYVREKFPLADKGMFLCGGDFDAFEVVLAIAYYGDEKLAADVQSGKKIHALFGTKVYPNMSYEDILADKEKYTRSKSGVFALIYFGNEHTLKTRLGVPIEDAEKAYQAFVHDYPGIGQGRKLIIDMFQSMRQPGGIGTKVEWNEPNEYIESMFGFRRWFTLENQICKTLFNLAQKPPKSLRGHKAKVVRRDREQTVSGAVQSALYAAAFALQATVTRAAGNHVIQSSGAQITKRVQRKIWDVQPNGVGPWVVQPMNIHDEVMCPTAPEYVSKVKAAVDKTVESFKGVVPLIKMKWDIDLKSWADK